MRCCVAGRAGPIRARRIRISCWARCCGSWSAARRWQRGKRCAPDARFSRRGRRRCAARNGSRGRARRGRGCWHLRTATRARADRRHRANDARRCRGGARRRSRGSRARARARPHRRRDTFGSACARAGKRRRRPRAARCSTALRAQWTHWQPRRCCSARLDTRRRVERGACGDARSWWLRLPVPWRRPN